MDIVLELGLYQCYTREIFNVIAVCKKRMWSTSTVDVINTRDIETVEIVEMMKSGDGEYITLTDEYADKEIVIFTKLGDKDKIYYMETLEKFISKTEDGTRDKFIKLIKCNNTFYPLGEDSVRVEFSNDFYTSSRNSVLYEYFNRGARYCYECKNEIYIEDYSIRDGKQYNKSITVKDVGTVSFKGNKEYSIKKCNKNNIEIFVDIKIDKDSRIAISERFGVADNYFGLISSKINLYSYTATGLEKLMCIDKCNNIVTKYLRSSMLDIYNKKEFIRNVKKQNEASGTYNDSKRELTLQYIIDNIRKYMDGVKKYDNAGDYIEERISK